MVDAREYHEETKHSPRSVREDSFRLDRSNRPRPYKVYEGLPRVPAAEPASVETPVLEAVATAGSDPPPGAVADSARGGSGAGSDAGPGSGPDRDPDVDALCYHATGVTKELERRGQSMRFRAAACTGKLYHVDLYAVTGDCGRFDPGVYHYDPEGDAFDVLREGDYRGVLAAAAGGHEGVANAPVTFVAASEWWRNAWKYRSRTYRHAFWDSGTILANLLAAAHGAGHRAEVVAGFADDPVADLLGLDPDEEAPLELVPVGSGDPVPGSAGGAGDHDPGAPDDAGDGAADPVAVDPIAPETIPPSDRIVEYPLVPDAWRQSRLDRGEVDALRDRFAVGGPGDGVAVAEDAGDGEWVELDPVDADTASARPVTATVERRGSLREYSRDPVSARKVATVFDRALGGLPVDCFGPGRVDGILDYYCLVLGVEGVSTGTYQYHPDETALERVGDADRETAGRLALDQSVVGDAAVNVYCLADLDRVVECAGDRGYRLAQLAGGLALGRLYLATYAHLSLGGRGFTFYDDLVTDHLAPRGADHTPMTLFAFGSPPA
ncbi:MAG: SagB family peptide dehydrogenase [Haloarculaceae archaeon]